jgi:predicted MFS family arabinose efflux permease
MPSQSSDTGKIRFTNYQKFVIAILSFLQFTVILDFMILSPLGAILLRDLGMGTSQFGLVVSAYAFSAGISGLLTAGFADKFDRKRLLLFFYAGFVLGTFLCGLAPDYKLLLAARIVTGLFGGVIGSVSLAIVADLFPLSLRGRVMGFVQSSFAASQVLGIPVGLFCATHWGWHAPFLLIAAVATVAGVVIALRLRPVTDHLEHKLDRHPLQHLFLTAIRPRYILGFGSTILLATGGFMLMPFGSTFSVNNLGISLEKLPMVYFVTGLFALVTGPLVGRLSDSIGKYFTLCLGTFLNIATILYFTRLGITPLWAVMLINIVLFVGISARSVSASALTSGLPTISDRGAYMSISSSLQQISGGVAAWLAGQIVVQSASGKLEHYEILGWVVTGTMTITMLLMWFVNQRVGEKAMARG